MPFPPPTHDHVEAPMAETIDEYLRPKKSAIHTDNRKGPITEEMTLIGIAHALIKDQLLLS
ncbi:hypothetical protein [Photobacterium sanguinicancri]|uniref:hypothetical protein n=1 Tax=Photobacterium sanguinicancri TaxID=875932 RepID=UPI003D11E178